MAGKTREEHVKECPAFGWDKASGQGGYDPTTGECGVCEAQDRAMATACKAEFEAGQAAAAAAKEAKQETAPVKAPKVAETSKVEKTPAKEAEPAAVKGDPAMARATAGISVINITPTAGAKGQGAVAPAKAADRPRPVKASPATGAEGRGPGKVITLAGIMSDGAPRTRKALVEAITAACGGSAAASASIISVAFGFGEAAGFVRKDGKTYSLAAARKA